jgi:hypothetical protein
MQSFSSLALAGTLGVAVLYAGLDMQASSEPPIDTIKTSAVSDGQTYRLSTRGRPFDCTLAVGGSAPRTVTLSADCALSAAPLAKSARWVDEPRGTILLADADGAALARFAPGDGVAYESMERGAPLYTLLTTE